MLDPPAVRRGKRLRLLGMITLALLAGIPLSMAGLDDNAAILGPLAMAHITLTAGSLAAAYALAGVGLALTLLRFIAKDSPNRPWLALALGPGLMLWVSHGLGVLGLLSGPSGRWVGLATVALGLVLLALPVVEAIRNRPNLKPPPWGGALWALGFAVMFVAASHPPGVLWASEARGYDSLSYHLSLPQEWAQGDRLWPLAHNVYSYLPSYVEAGFLHLGAMVGAGEPGRGVPVGLVAGDGTGAIACHWLSGIFSLLSAIVLARVVWVVADRAGVAPAGARHGSEAGAIAGAVLLSTPWVLVVSSLAYNESAVNLLFAGALLAALDARLAPTTRGVLAGLMVGAACGAKPTALFLIGPTVALALLAYMPPRRWPVAVLAGCGAGLLMIGPFLIRNWLASGNPVFPAATALWGHAPWSAEQVARFGAAHRESAPLLDRVGLLLASTGDGLGAEPRGIFHTQWAALFPAGAIGLVLAATFRPTRGLALILAGGTLAGLAWWITGSHCQSRFLLPLAVPMALALGLAALAAYSRTGAGWTRFARRLALIILMALPLVLAASAATRLRSEINRQGTSFLPDGTGPFTGDRLRLSPMFQAADELSKRDVLNDVNPYALINLGGGGVGPADTVYLLGDATPLFLARRVLWATTWDESILARSIGLAPDDPAAWGRALAARGVDFVLVSFGELDRLRRSGWLDPRLSPEAVTRFLQTCCQPVRAWDDSGQALFRLKPLSPGGERPL